MLLERVPHSQRKAWNCPSKGKEKRIGGGYTQNEKTFLTRLGDTALPTSSKALIRERNGRWTANIFSVESLREMLDASDMEMPNEANTRNSETRQIDSLAQGNHQSHGGRRLESN